MPLIHLPSRCRSTFLKKSPDTKQKEFMMSSPPTGPEDVPEQGEPWSEEQPETHYRREDNRWHYRARFRDWMILLMMIVTYVVWAGIIYLLEPGIR